MDFIAILVQLSWNWMDDLLKEVLGSLQKYPEKLPG